MKTFRKNMLIGVALTVFCLFGMVSNSAALIIPDEQTTIPTSATQPYGYVAWAHDDFWSYSAKLIVANPTVFPVDYYGDWSVNMANGQLINIFTNGVAQPNGTGPGYTFAAPVQEIGNPQDPSYEVSWGLPTDLQPDLGKYYPASGSVTVASVLNYLNYVNPYGNTIPVFGLSVQAPDPAAFAFVGHVYIVEGTSGSNYGNVLYDWAFDQNPQIDTFTSSSPSRVGTLDVDYPGFGIDGYYNNDAPGLVIPFSGNAWLDYFTYAPSMDLAILTQASPGLLDDYFVVNFIVGNGTYPQNGTVHAVLLGNVGFPDQVPEPSSMLLLGFGLVGLAAMRRKFKK